MLELILRPIPSLGPPWLLPTPPASSPTSSPFIRRRPSIQILPHSFSSFCPVPSSTRPASSSMRLAFHLQSPGCHSNDNYNFGLRTPKPADNVPRFSWETMSWWRGLVVSRTQTSPAQSVPAQPFTVCIEEDVRPIESSPYSSLSSLSH